MRESPGLLSTQEFIEYQHYLTQLVTSVMGIPVDVLREKTVLPKLNTEKEELLEIVIAIENF